MVKCERNLDRLLEFLRSANSRCLLELEDSGWRDEFLRAKIVHVAAADERVLELELLLQLAASYANENRSEFRTVPRSTPLRRETRKTCSTRAKPVTKYQYVSINDRAVLLTYLNAFQLKSVWRVVTHSVEHRHKRQKSRDQQHHSS